MVIDVAKSADYYVEGAKVKVEKLINKYTARTDKLARATSPEADKAYREALADEMTPSLRLLRLKELTEEDLNIAMREKGRAAYPRGVELAKDKYAKRFEPYAREIDTILPKLAPKTRDVRTNVMERVIPIAVGLRNKKRAILGIRS